MAYWGAGGAGGWSGHGPWPGGAGVVMTTDAAAPPDAGTSSAEGRGSAMSMKWYVIHTYSGHENKVKQSIEKAVELQAMTHMFGQVLIPMEEVTEMKKGKKVKVNRKFFPSYILVHIELTEEMMHLVNNIPGVTRFVGTGNRPVPVTEKEVDRILKRGDTAPKEREIREIPFHVGEQVKVTDGPFSDFNGVIDEINPERGKLKVMVAIFGRETPVELDFLQVERL
jgi:transcriptional antiterminator NusG